MRVIRDRMGGKLPAPSGPTSSSAAEIVTDEYNPYLNEPEELAVLGSMVYSVLPAECTEKLKKSKPYECTELNKLDDKVLPVVPTQKEIQPNRAFMELPLTILKRPLPVEVPSQPMGPMRDDTRMEEVSDDDPEPS